jgi:hypothetical protein
VPQKTSSVLTENESAGPSEKPPRLVRNDRVNEFWGNIRWDFLSVRKKVQAKFSFLSAASELSAIPGRFAPESKKEEPRGSTGQEFGHSQSEAKREAPVRAKPHPTCPRKAKNHPSFVFRMHPIDFSQRFILC